MAGRVLVIGGTRGTGREVVKSLLACGRDVRLVARDPEKARRLFGDAVELHPVDLAAPDAAARLGPAFAGDLAGGVFTAAVPPGFASRAQLEAVDLGGVVATVEAARAARFSGRFVYMTTMGLRRPTWLTALLGLVKRGIVDVRLAAERVLAESRLDVVTVRAGILGSGRGGAPLDLVASDRPLTLATRIDRADVARVLLLALDAPRPPAEVSVFARSGAPAVLALPAGGGSA